MGNLTTFPNKVLFDCAEGFHLRGSRIRHCRENGTWSGTETFCEGNLMFLLQLFISISLGFKRKLVKIEIGLDKRWHLQLLPNPIIPV